MNILYYSPNPEQDMADDTGYGRHQREMISALRELGHEVDVVNITSGATGDTENGKSQDHRSSLKQIIPAIIWSTLRDIKRILIDRFRSTPILEEALNNKEYDVIYERSNYLLISGLRAAQRRNMPLVLEINAPCVVERKAFEGNSWLAGVAKNRESRKYRYASRIFPVTSILGSYLSEKYKIPESKVRFIPNAINDSEIITHENESLQSLKSWCSDSLVFGFMGSLLAYHGVEKLIEAFLKLAHKYPDIKLLIVGDGEVLPILKEIAARSKFAERIRFTGQVSRKDVYFYVSLMDVGVSPDHSWYGSPIKIFEYAALGAVVLAPDSENIRDIFNHSEDSWLFNSTEELELGMEELITNSSVKTELSEKAKAKVLTSHTWRANAETVIENLNQILES